MPISEPRGPLPNGETGESYILVMVDECTRWLGLVGLSTIRAAAAVQAGIDAWICRYGTPEAIVTDNGTQFTLTTFDRFCQKQEIRHVPIVPQNPQANLAGRVIRDTK